MLDLLGYAMLLAPFAFFFCCCRPVCTACPAGTSNLLQVTFPGIVPAIDCEDCERLAETVFSVPGGGGGVDPTCQWFFIGTYEEHLCQPVIEEPPAISGLILFQVFVTVTGGNISVTLAAFLNTTGGSVGTHDWTMPMPDHDETSGPCPPQTIEFEADGVPPSMDPLDFLNSRCDFSACTPIVVFT